MKKMVWIYLLLVFTAILSGQNAKDYRIPPSSLPGGWSLNTEGSPSLDRIVQSTRIRKEVYQELGFQSCFIQAFNTPRGGASVEIFLYSNSGNSAKMFEIEKQINKEQKIKFSTIGICGEDGIKVRIMGITTYMFAKRKCFYGVRSRDESITRQLAELACSAGSRVAPSGRKSKGLPEWMELFIILGAVYGLVFLGRLISRLLKKKPKPIPRAQPPAAEPEPPVEKAASRPKITLDLNRPVQQSETKPKVVLNLGPPAQPPLEPKVREKESEEKKKKPQPVTLELSSNLKTLKKNTQKQASIMALVKDEKGIPLPGEEVTFQSDQGSFKAMDPVTDPSGTARAIWQVDEDSQGTVKIKANCKSKPVVFDILPIQVEGKPEPVRVKALAHPDTLPADGRSKALINVQLWDIHEKPVDNWPVSFRTNPDDCSSGLFREGGQTNAQGQLEAEFTMPRDVRGKELHIYAEAEDGQGRRIAAGATIKVDEEFYLEVSSLSQDRYYIYASKEAVEKGKHLAPEAVKRVEARNKEGVTVLLTIGENPRELYLPAMIGYFGFSSQYDDFYRNKQKYFQNIAEIGNDPEEKAKREQAKTVGFLASSIDDIIGGISAMFAVFGFFIYLATTPFTMTLTCIGYFIWSVLDTFVKLLIPISLGGIKSTLISKSALLTKIQELGQHIQKMIVSMETSQYRAARLAKRWKDLSYRGSETSSAQCYELLSRQEKTLVDEYYDAITDSIKEHFQQLDTLIDLCETIADYASYILRILYYVGSSVDVTNYFSTRIQNKIRSILASRTDLPNPDISLQEIKNQVDSFWNELTSLDPKPAVLKPFFRKYRGEIQKSLAEELSVIHNQREKESEQHRAVMKLRSALIGKYQAPV